MYYREIYDHLGIFSKIKKGNR